MVEFTGERVVPGHVNADLWSEHLARYAFARRYAEGRDVLDAGCGTGYGSAELAQVARGVIGFDLSVEAAAYARAAYPIPRLAFAAGSCELLPFAGDRFGLVAAFEVIEHLANYRQLISEAARVLKNDGIFIVSTPNKKYYAESRAQTGPNPYHRHEFEAGEFHAELSAVFRNVCLLLQNRVESFAFHPARTFWPAEARIDGGAGSSEDAHFFVALCSHAPLPEMRSFVYVPKAANILREREQHVQLLEAQLDQTNEWLNQTGRERDDVLALYRKQKQELEDHNRWAADLSRQLGEARTRIVSLQGELAREQAAAAGVAKAYERKVQELEGENREKTQWARDTEARLTAELQAKTAELHECVRLLDQAEATVVERTHWAQRADAQNRELDARLLAVRASRWVKLGNRLRLGPVIREP